MSWSCCGLRWGVGRRVGCVGEEARKRVAASSKHIDGGEAWGMRTRNTWRRWGELGSRVGTQGCVDVLPMHTFQDRV